MTSGKKLPPAVKNICLVLQKINDKDLAASLVEKEKKLKSPAPSSFVSQLKRRALAAMSPGQGCKRQKQEPAASSATVEDELASLRALYGLAGPPSASAEIEILSSQEPSCSAAGASAVSGSSSNKVQFVQYETPEEVVRLYPCGKKVASKLRSGPNGFAVASFDEDVVQTEFPNLLLLPVMRKPAAAMKKPSAANAANTSASSEEDQAGEEEEEAAEDGVAEAEDGLEEDEEGTAKLPDGTGLTSLAATYGHKALLHKPKPHTLKTVTLCISLMLLSNDI